MVIIIFRDYHFLTCASYKQEKSMKFLLIILLTTFIVLSNAGFLKGACSDSDEFCGNNGLCEFGPFQNERATHWCRCKEGFGGANCEKRCDLNCAPDEKCVFDFAFRAQCVCKDCDNHGQQLSQCPVGFGGSNCSRHGWCYGNEGCLNGGACIGSGADARCSCLSGYTGRRCELDVDECAAEDAVVCYNGECINTFGSYECKCHPGFIQPECIFEGTAFDNPPPVERACIRSLIADANGKDERCRNSGVCVTDGMNQTRCECPPGFEGELCEKDVDECAHSPCQNGATCTNYKGGFECFCMIGFEGDLCEINVDNCVGNKCANGSKCIDGIGWYTCECPYGRMGTYCENVDPCALDSDLCNGRGTCVSLPETGGFECNCDRGFSGERCDVDFDECKELSHHTELCYHGGTCVNLPGTFKCDCPRGYNGTRCEEILNTCESENVHCENGGSCFVGPDQEPICQCEQGFIGKRCESKCPDGFGGVRCDVNLSVPICGRNIAKCLNKGMCINGMCRCSANYTGDHCEMSRKELYAFSVENSCHRDPCLNNATCINVDHKIGYVCICPEGFDGDVCERKKDYCDSHPCFNGGTCERHSTDFTCKCAAGYTGKHCETEQSCSSRTCKNGGRCVDAGGRLVCECSYGFAGPTCEHKVEVERFKTTESLLKDLCRSRNCSSRANDGNCDLDCNYGACDFDGGDCTGNQRPFANCRYGNMCAHLFANGVCNEACNNEECLYDGMDCLPQVPRCPVHIREHCADRYANGHCDSECNTDGCGFDGGDCDNSTQIVLSDIRVKLLISPTRFQKEGAEFLITASSALRSVIRIQRDDNGPLVFEWNGEEEGDRIPMNMKKLKDQRILSEHIRHRRGLSETRNNQNGVVVWLEVEVNDQKSETCKMDRSSCLFSTSQSVVDYFSAEIAKKRDGLFGVPIYEAMVAKPRTASKWSDQGLVMAVIGFVVVGIVIAGVLVMNDEKRTRKRRIISAPVWMPPTEQENEKMRKHNNLSSSQNSLLGNNGYFDNKRRRVDLGYNMIGNEQYNYRNGGGYPVNFASEFGGYGNTEVPLQLNENGKEVPELHYQASGNGRIVIPLDKNNVNEMDKKYGRRALHWLASNNTGKSEELIIEEANMCIQAGAEVNARDFDDDTALMLAVRAKRVRLAVVLMSAGADPTIFNKSERSALHEAAVNLDFRMICILLTDKRLVQEIDELDRNGKSALMEVARLDRDTQIAQFLINKGAKIENDGASRKDSEVYKGRTALHFAAMVGNLTMVEFLVLQNANKDKQDEMGQTPIMLAAKEGHLETVQYLLSQGASMDATDQLDKTARQIAESQHHYDIVDLIDRAAIDKEHNENMMRQRLHHPSKVGVSKMTRPTIKAVKRSASRKGYQSSSSRDSTIHMTPPPSDGSLSSPSPQHYLNTTRTTPTVLNYPNSPVSQFATNCSNMYNPNSNGSCSASSDSSPEYTSQEMEMTNNTMNGASMWYGNSPPYPKTMNGFYDNAMSNMDRSNQTALYF